MRNSSVDTRLFLVVYTIISNTFAIFIIPEIISHTVYNRFVKRLNTLRSKMNEWKNKKTYNVEIERRQKSRKPFQRLGVPFPGIRDTFRVNGTPGSTYRSGCLGIHLDRVYYLRST